MNKKFKYGIGILGIFYIVVISGCITGISDETETNHESDILGVYNCTEHKTKKYKHILKKDGSIIITPADGGISYTGTWERIDKDHLFVSYEILGITIGRKCTIKGDTYTYQTNGRESICIKINK